MSNGKQQDQVPLAKERTSGTTLLSIVESKGQNIGTPTIESGTILEKDKAAFSKAIPADRLEQVISAGNSKKRKQQAVVTRTNGTLSSKQIKRGMVMNHKSTGKKVVIVKTNVSSTGSGELQHLVMVAGTDKKYIVKESNLE